MGAFYAGVGDELTLYVRHLAWLHTAPKPRKPAKGEAPKPVSRMSRMKAEQREIRMPPVELPFLVEQLLEIGLFESSGMDRVPVSWRELDAYANRIPDALPPWRARLMRRLSESYLAECGRAEDPSCPAPWTDDVIDAADIAAELRGLEALGED